MIVVVPGHAGRDEQVALEHRELLPVDHRERAVIALDYPARGRRCVAVAERDVARHQVLEGGGHRPGRPLEAGGGIDEVYVASIHHFERDYLAGLHEGRVDLVPFP